mmetsp:Transcript_17530/g.52738  ORF Transcript_17530/g.52738 Transcript_17530/m.52738 type:complete len:264 (+) Transcript_17530:600-1391(+)
MLAGHHEELAHHAAALANVLLHQLAARHPDEAALRVVRHGPREQRLAGAWRPVEEDTLRLRDAQGFEDLGMLDGQLDDLLDLLDLLVHASHHLVSAVGRLLHAHQLHERVYLAREDLVQHVGLAAQGDAGVRLAVVDGDVLVNVDHVLALLAHLHEHLLLPHGLDHLAAVRCRLQQHVELLPQEPHPAVELVALRLKTPLVVLAILDQGLHLLNVGIVVALDPGALLRLRRHHSGGGHSGGRGEALKAVCELVPCTPLLRERA